MTNIPSRQQPLAGRPAQGAGDDVDTGGGAHYTGAVGVVHQGHGVMPLGQQIKRTEAVPEDANTPDTELDGLFPAVLALYELTERFC